MSVMPADAKIVKVWPTTDNDGEAFFSMFQVECLSSFPDWGVEVVDCTGANGEFGGFMFGYPVFYTDDPDLPDRVSGAVVVADFVHDFTPVAMIKSPFTKEVFVKIYDGESSKKINFKEFL
jgi:hypothetical protein